MHRLRRSFSLPARLFGRLFRRLNRRRQWYRWRSSAMQVVNIVAIRVNLRRFNLYHTESAEPPLVTADSGNPDTLRRRTTDGSYNDLRMPSMGRAGTRFGRNMPVDRTWPDQGDKLMTPNPRTISRKLMTREEFQPATILNVMAAAWIQFMVHDWFSHGSNDRNRFYEIPLEPDDPWPDKPMKVMHTIADSTRGPADDGLPPTFLNTETHWWDGSQIYGSTKAIENKVRAHIDGKLAIGEDGLLPVDEHGIDVSGVTGNWWIGLSLLHTLFTLEHNAICDRLKRDYPDWDDERLFAKARLINAAQLAKVHTVEWTPALLDTPALRFGMRANWWGLLGEDVYRRCGRFGRGDLISGITGSPTDHHSAPYTLTEEFVSVYRMHPLMPDEFSFRAAADGSEITATDLRGVSAENSRKLYDRVSAADAWYSLGTRHPGAITLHNYPRQLQELIKQTTGRRVDLAAIDILRDRERGVPRYNEFRQHLDLPRIERFEDLTPNQDWAAEIREAYGGDIDKVDLLVGLLGEQPPPGFAFSDTAFRIFILMASRRLKSDRFFTEDYTAEVYTQAGMDWIDDNTMTTILLRHYPALAPAVTGIKNVFAPWNETIAATS